MTTEAAEWTLSSYVTPGAKVYQCGTYVLLGGYNILGGNGPTGTNAYYGQYFARTYNSVPIHNQIYIQILFYAIDSWDGGTDHFNIGIDNNSIFGWTLSKQPAYSTYTCGKSIDPEIPPFTAFVSYAHSATSLVLKIINYADEASENESLGFRDIKIEFLTSSTPYSSLCSASSAPLETTTSCGSSCSSPDLSMNPPGSGICTPTSCSSSCNTCAGSSTTCATCKTGEYMIGTSCYSDCNDPYLPAVLGGVTYCTTPCPGKFIWSDKSCSSVCSYSTGFSTFEMTGSVVQTFSQCDFPCGTNQYLYWNTSCFDSCPAPLTKLTYKGKNLCEFHCDSSQYLYWNGSCEAQCEFPLVSEVQNGRKFCWYPCQESEFLYWNGSCIETCPLPLTPEIQQGRKFCWYGCSETQHLYWNGSCIEDCNSPLISEVQGTKESRIFCWSPCQVDQYIYWNRSCSSECPFPLAEKIEPQIQFCQNPCGDFSTNYLYSNQSCFSTCPSPLSVINNPGVQYCVNLCPSGTYLYENKTCLSGCSSPYLKRTEPGVQYCDRPCSQPNIYWYQNASCLPECKFPYVQFNYSDILECLPPCKDASEYFYEYEKKCYSACESPYKIELVDLIKVCKVGVSLSHEEVEKIKGTVATLEKQGEVVSGGIKVAGLVTSNNPSSALLAGLSSMVLYIRYMKINYPPKVQMLFMVSTRNPFTFNYGVKIPSYVKEHLEDDPLPYAFDRYDISSNFVRNLWDFMVSLSLQLLAILALTIVKMMTSGHRKINVLLKKILQMFKWNFPIMMVCGSSADIFFFGSLQLRSSPFMDLSSKICCIISILMMILVVLLLGVAFRIAYVMHRRSQNPAQEISNRTERWKGFEILYVEYEEKSFFSLAYMFLFLSRNIIFNLTLATLFEYPLVECIIINVCNFAMICYLLYLRPLKDLFALIQLWINEGLLNILSISVLILGVLDYLEVQRQTTRNGMEEVILIVIKTFNFAALAFMGIGALLFMRAVYRIWKTGRSKDMRSPLQMLNFLFFGGDEEEEEIGKVGKCQEFSKKNIQIEKDLRENNTSIIDLKGDHSLVNIICETTIIQDSSTKILQTEFIKGEQQATDFEMSPQLFFNPQNNIQMSEVEEEYRNVAEGRKRKVKVKRRNNILANGRREINDPGPKNNEAENELWFLKFRKLQARLNLKTKKMDLTIEKNHSHC